MARISIQASSRENLGTKNMKKLRKEGVVPAVIYGKDRETLPLAVTLLQVKRAISTNSIIAELEIDKKEKLLAQIKKIQWDNTRDNIYHVDFHVIKPDQWIEVDVPLVIKGEPKGIAEGGVLDINLRTLKLECKPDQIPARILVDVSELVLNTKKRIQDIQLPQGTKTRAPGNLVIAGCVKPLELPTEPVPAATSDEVKEPEVIKKKKEEEVEEGAEAKGKEPAKDAKTAPAKAAAPAKEAKPAK